jgi:hypothetical protein
MSHRLGEGGTELLGEITADTFVGSGAPAFLESPVRLGVGARHPLSRSFLLMGSAEASLSQRPSAPDPAELFPIEPRVTATLSLVFRLMPDEPAPPPPPPVEQEPEPEPAPPEEPAVAEVPSSDVVGTVVDEGGRPLPDVEVTLNREGAEPVKERTAADGSFKFAEVPEGPVQLAIETVGYDPGNVEFAAGEERSREIVMRPAVPAGQVRGRVLDLSGNPVTAKVTISPGDHLVEVQADGSFELELAPGRYTVVFEHPDFTNQRRVIRIVDRGVVILNIALTR